MRILFKLVIILFSVPIVSGQTTDLAITVEAQDLLGNSISQAHFYERYQYLITISNTGAPVTNATYNLSLSSVENIESTITQNLLGGAVVPINQIVASDNVSGELPSMPNSSSLELLITVRASPIFLGGATATATVSPPSGTVDVNPATNSSIISIIMTERPIDFQLTQTQILPAANASLGAWGDLVTYEMTILNNSSIEYPLEDFEFSMQNINGAGSAIVSLQNLSCTGATGMSCPSLQGLNSAMSSNITSLYTFYDHPSEIVFPAGASFTMQVTYQIEEGDCSPRSPNEPLKLGHDLVIESYVNNTGFAIGNRTETTTLLINPCPCTDLRAEVIRISPTSGSLNSWLDIVTYDFTFTNDGPSDILGGGTFLNTSTLNTGIEILSVSCINTTGTLSCSDITITTIPDFNWTTGNFIFPSGSSATFRTTVRFLPPDCTPNGATPTCRVRGLVFDSDLNLTDCDLFNDFDDNSIQGIPITPCIVDPAMSPITLTEVQTNPVPGAGPYPYGNIEYEIVMANVDSIPHRVRFKDIQFSQGTGVLQSIICTGTSGGASCPISLNENIGVANSNGDTFWEILDSDNFVLPANSSITYEKVIDWTPECSVIVTNVQDSLVLSALDANSQVIATAGASVSTPMVPCVDIVVQTFPSVTSAPINSSLEWIVDITNSNISVDASNITFNDLLHPDFIINGAPTCTLVTGNATCITSFTVTGNQIDTTIPFMESGSTIQVRVPVTAPNYGGSFENRAEAQPDFTQQGENTPDSNISTSSLFILTTQTSKIFDPAIINTGETSILSFTLTNSVGSPAQSNISFLDNLPPEITLTGNAFWIDQNNATATFVDAIGSSIIGVQNLSFPSGTSEVSFGVEVTSDDPDIYINDFQNFSNLNNIDISTAFASLEVLPILDLQINKTVDNVNPDINDSVVFTITVQNIGDAIAMNVIVEEILPSGYNYLSHIASNGVFDNSTGLWEVGDMMAGDTATLEITVDLNIPGNYLNVVVVSHANMLTDIDLENNTSQASTRPDCLRIPEGFSPNSDGINDTFQIDCIQLYPNNKLKIFNRYGTVVYKKSNYVNDWNGIPNAGLLNNDNQLLPTGTYFWQLDLGDGSPARAGWIYINY